MVDVQGAGVIDDGYTRPAYLAGIQYEFPAVRFSYRPPLVRDLSIIRAEISRAPAATVPALQAAAIAKYVTQWDLKDKEGNPVALKPEALLRVESGIFDGVSGIVLRIRSTDIDPTWAKDVSNREISQGLESVFGKDLLAMEDAEVKN